MSYFRKSTQLDGVDAQRDFVVLFERESDEPKDIIGRVMHHESGPLRDVWTWHLQWLTNGNNGQSDTLEQALLDVKNRHMAAGQPPSAASQSSRARAGYRWKHGSTR